MTSEGFSKALRSFSVRSPFTPFNIELMSGEKLLVIHPEAAVIRKGIVHYVDKNRRNHLFDAHSVSRLFDPETH